MSSTPEQKSYSHVDVDMRFLVRALIKYKASDLHLKAGRPPMFRINGKLVAAKMPELTPEQAEKIIMSILSARQQTDLEKRRSLDLSFMVRDLGRFRCNVYFQRNTLAAAIRMVPLSVASLEELGIPLVLKELVQRPRGLLLITGPTGSGKSTTLASMIHYLNETSPIHVLALEDPIEYLHRDLKATISQREIGVDANSLREALYAGLRQDPDVIMIGELRDYETIQVALSAAETGHLVLATMHTNDARGTVDRILDVFPVDGKNQARIQLASTLVGVVCQQLVLRADGTGRVPACEVMVKSPIIESYILKNELEKIPDAIANSNNYYKMQTLNQALENLIRNGVISTEEGMKVSLNGGDLKLSLSGMVREEGYQVAGIKNPHSHPDDEEEETDKTVARFPDPLPKLE
jgi:twitching motility protein PilT